MEKGIFLKIENLLVNKLISRNHSFVYIMKDMACTKLSQGKVLRGKPLMKGRWTNKLVYNAYLGGLPEVTEIYWCQDPHKAIY